MSLNQAKYSCSDLTLATTLLLHSFTLIDIDRTNPRRAVFLFEDSNQLQDVVNDFWNSKLSVEPHSFADKTKWLKSRIYAE